MQESTKAEFKFGEFIKSEKFIETAILVLFVSLFIFLKVAQPWGYQISHPYPAFYNANDNFINGYIYPQSVKENGNFRFEPEQVTSYKNIVGYYPVILTHLSAMFSIISGIETYDTSYIICTTFLISAALLIYFVIRRYSKELALISLPFMIGVFNFDFEIARAFGLWIYITGAIFLAAVIWLADRLGERNAAVLLTIFLTGAALGHMPEAIFGVGFLIFYSLLIRLKEGAFDKPWVKNAILGIGAFFIFALYYMIIFKYTFMVWGPYKFEYMAAPPFAPNFGVKLTDFGILTILILAGAIMGLKRMTFRKKEEIPFTAIAAGLYVLVVGYSNYVGIGIRAWQTRIAWLVYFAVFSGIVVYYLGRKLLKRWNFMYSAAISLILLLSFSYMHEGKLQGGGIIDQGEWGAFTWIKQNTSVDAKIAHFPSTYSEQPASIWSTGRLAYRVQLSDYIDSAQNGVVKEQYNVDIFYQLLPSNETENKLASILRQPGFDGDYRLSEKLTTDDMDYYVFLISGQSVNPAVLQHNNAIRNKFMESGSVEVYNNGEVSILKRVK